MADRVYKERLVKEAVKYGAALVGVLVVVSFVGSLIGMSTGKIAFLAMLAVGVAFAAAAVPKSLYCSDCGQFWGKENDYKVPCPRCGCNIYTRTQAGAGQTVRVR